MTPLATSVLDLRGPDFLKLYAALAPLSFAAAWVLRTALRAPAGEPAPRQLDLDPYDIACLANGRTGAIDAAIAALVQRGTVTLAKPATRLLIHDITPTRLHPLEHLVYSVAQKHDGDVREIRASIDADRPMHRLVQRDLVLSDGQFLVARVLPLCPPLAVLCLGIAKIFVGLSRNRPVEFLVLLCIATAAGATALFAKTSHRTRKGDRALQMLRDANTALESTARHSANTLAAEDLVIAIALFGPAILSTGPLGELHRLLYPPEPISSNGGWHSCASGGCGSAGCGGGGCGGGCGGCGG